MKKLLLLLILPLQLAGREFSQDLAQKTFLHVWEKVDESFFEEANEDLDWNQVKSKYGKRVKKADSNQELRRILNEMLGELKLSHFGVSKAGWDFEGDDTAGDYLGLELRAIGQQVVVFEVEGGSAAALAGMKPGMILTEFEGIPMKDLVAEFELTPKSNRLTRLMATRSILDKLSNPKDGKTTLKIQGAELAFDFKPGFYEGERGRMGNETDLPVSFETRVTEGDQKIRIIAFDLFIPKLMPRILKAIAQARAEKAGGLVFDLRGNPGGLGVMAPGVIGRLIEEDLDLGDMNNTAGNIPFHAFPQKGAYLGPVAVLIDSFSASTSEIFAAGLQEHQRARIFGRTSTGAVLPSVIEELPNGDSFQYAVGDFVTAVNQVHLEGRGVIPDELIPLDPKLLSAGKDSDLSAAVNWLKKQSTQ